MNKEWKICDKGPVSNLKLLTTLVSHVSLTVSTKIIFEKIAIAIQKTVMSASVTSH